GCGSRGTCRQRREAAGRLGKWNPDAYLESALDVVEPERVVVAIQILEPGPGIGQADTLVEQRQAVRLHPVTAVHDAQDQLQPVAFGADGDVSGPGMRRYPVSHSVF